MVVTTAGAIKKLHSDLFGQLPQDRTTFTNYQMVLRFCLGTIGSDLLEVELPALSEAGKRRLSHVADEMTRQARAFRVSEATIEAAMANLHTSQRTIYPQISVYSSVCNTLSSSFCMGFAGGASGGPNFGLWYLLGRGPSGYFDYEGGYGLGEMARWAMTWMIGSCHRPTFTDCTQLLNNVQQFIAILIAHIHRAIQAVPDLLSQGADRLRQISNCESIPLCEILNTEVLVLCGGITFIIGCVAKGLKALHDSNMARDAFKGLSIAGIVLTLCVGLVGDVTAHIRATYHEDGHLSAHHFNLAVTAMGLISGYLCADTARQLADDETRVFFTLLFAGVFYRLYTWHQNKQAIRQYGAALENLLPSQALTQLEHQHSTAEIYAATQTLNETIRKTDQTRSGRIASFIWGERLGPLFFRAFGYPLGTPADQALQGLKQGTTAPYATTVFQLFSRNTDSVGVTVIPVDGSPTGQPKDGTPLVVLNPLGNINKGSAGVSLSAQV